MRKFLNQESPSKKSRKYDAASEWTEEDTLEIIEEMAKLNLKNDVECCEALVRCVTTIMM